MRSSSNVSNSALFALSALLIYLILYHFLNFVNHPSDAVKDVICNLVAKFKALDFNTSPVIVKFKANACCIHKYNADSISGYLAPLSRF